MSCCGGSKSCAPAPQANPQGNGTTPMQGHQEIKDSVTHYYGQSLQSTKDLRTSACQTCKAPPPEVKALMKQLPQEILSACIAMLMLSHAALPAFAQYANAYIAHAH
eukprot:1160265-Pelagomonas_calceolata.AAC.3